MDISNPFKSYSDFNSVDSKANNVPASKVIPPSTADNGSSVYLGPQLWDYTMPIQDFTLDVMNLNEFLADPSLQEDIAKLFETADAPAGSKSTTASSSMSTASSSGTSATSTTAHTVEKMIVDNSPSVVAPQTSKRQKRRNEAQSVSNDLCGNMSSQPASSVPVKIEALLTSSASSMSQELFDPSVHRFNTTELQPQPVAKKARKNLVPPEFKDEKYWFYRHKNNVAAKRSRDARRMKENQIGMRAAFLETENEDLKNLVKRLRQENECLLNRLQQYEVNGWQLPAQP